MTALLARFRGIIGVTAAAGFDPATLFASGEDGAWYDPSDLSTVFTTDGSGNLIPASVGDDVAQINDKSGNGNHATQATVSFRPILRQSGSLYYLEFDGIDDRMSFSQITSVNGATCFIGVKFDIISTSSLIYEGSSPILAYTANFVQDFALGARTGAASLYVENGSSNIEVRSTSSIGTTSPYVITGFSSSAESGIRVDGGTTVAGAASRDDLIVRALGKDSASVFFNGNLYGVIFRGTTSSTQEIAGAESYIADKTGVTL